MSLFRQKHATTSLPMRAVALIAVLGFALAACGDGETETGADEPEPDGTAEADEETGDTDEPDEVEDVGA